MYCKAGNNFSRAQGNPKNAMISQLIGAGFNILFDYILICIFHMGMQGAAFATIGGQFLSALWQLAFLFGKRTIIPLNATLLKLQLNISKQIIQTGIPAFLMQISNSVLNIILNASLVKIWWRFSVKCYWYCYKHSNTYFDANYWFDARSTTIDFI